jgi:hypothetical protein
VHYASIDQELDQSLEVCVTSCADEVKDRLGDQRGGSEWQPIKILLQIENSAYAPNSQPRIPIRVCQVHVVTTDLPTLGTTPNNPEAKARIKKQRT